MMSKGSTIRGTILPEKEIVDFHGEELVKATLLLDGCKFPILGGKNALLRPEGKCNIECIPIQEQLKKGRRSTYLYAVRADVCEESNLEDKNRLKLEGVIDKIYPTYYVGSMGVPCTRVKLYYQSRGKGLTFIDICATGAYAEKCARVKPGDKITAKVYIDYKHDELIFNVVSFRFTTK